MIERFNKFFRFAFLPFSIILSNSVYAHAHGEQVVVLLFSDILFLVISIIFFFIWNQRGVSKVLLFTILISLTIIKYLLPFPYINLLLSGSISQIALAIFVHIFPTIIVCILVYKGICKFQKIQQSKS